VTLSDEIPIGPGVIVNTPTAPAPASTPAPALPASR